MDPDRRRSLGLPTSSTLAAIVAASVLGCGTQAPVSGSSPPGSSASPASSVASIPSGAAPSADTLPYGGAGPVVVENMSAGLDALGSYRSTLGVAFEGSDAAAPRAWTMSLSVLQSGNPAATSLSIETSGAGAPLTPTLEVQRGGQTYTSTDGGGCAVRSTAEAGSIVGLLTPTRLLASVVGAEAAGRQAVGGVEADHLTFDESAVGLAGMADGKGELWVAVSGGAVMKETLSLTGAGLAYGEDTPGTMTWAYDLADVGSAVMIDLPAACSSGTLDLPIPADAGNLQRGPRAMSFDTPSIPSKVVAFYRDAGTKAGWAFTSEPYADSDRGLIEATVAGRAITIVITRVATGSSVLAAADD